LTIATSPTPSTPEDLYLDLMKKTLTRALVAKGLERHTIRTSRLVYRALKSVLTRSHMELVRLKPSTPEDYLESGHAAENRVEDAETMLGTRQLDQMQAAIVSVLEEKVPGDILEAGVWRGGMTLFMRAVLKAYGVTNRTVWVADSFMGLPAIDRSLDKFEWNAGDMAVSLEDVKQTFARYGLLDSQVSFLKGFFSETLPNCPVANLAILRIDADLYGSTADALTHLYPRLVPGGYAIFDDYSNLPDCRRAIEDYRRTHGISEPVIAIDQRAVFWRKSG
jgi:O-methyltransferase